MMLMLIYFNSVKRMRILGRGSRYLRNIRGRILWQTFTVLSRKRSFSKTESSISSKLLQTGPSSKKLVRTSIDAKVQCQMLVQPIASLQMIERKPRWMVNSMMISSQSAPTCKTPMSLLIWNLRRRILWDIQVLEQARRRLVSQIPRSGMTRRAERKHLG